MDIILHHVFVNAKNTKPLININSLQVIARVK